MNKVINIESKVGGGLPATKLEKCPQRFDDPQKNFKDMSNVYLLNLNMCDPWNCVAASALHAYRHCSYKEGSAGLVTLQDVPKVS